MSPTIERTAAPSTSGKEYKAKAGGGLELGGAELNEFAIQLLGVTEAFLAAEAVTNAKVKAAAGIEESKLSIPEMVKLTGVQTITGVKTFSGTGTAFTGNPTLMEFLSVGETMRFPGATINLEASPLNNYGGTAETGKKVWQRWKVKTVAEVRVTGLSIGNANGKFLFLTNAGTEKNIVLINETETPESEESLAANRFRLNPPGALTLVPGQSILLLYDNTASRWRNVTNPSQRQATEAAVEHAGGGTFEIEPSATRNCIVLLRVQSKPNEKAVEYNVKVGATTVTQIVIPELAGTIDQTLTFTVPFAMKLKIEKVGVAEVTKFFTQVTGV